CLQYSTSPYSF
nr:immunoglobulin light chain junction region [Macaca mulatta]MOW10245.1 immunoglobulin light chain junction region [Macaca mulatta]MOW12256.1 immunoglobulin light chain junction region [Macaca mulatta]MOW12570.1 immunoglobulin light chain junction region [Macaca mulatta]MOW13964.1 immunoglobulin light chain junction region [Macaca mulatta]